MAETRRTKKKKEDVTEIPESTLVRGGLFDNVVELAIIALCIILAASNFGFGGVVGGAVSSFGFAMIGWISYLFPVFLLAGCLYAVAVRGKKLATLKIIAIFVLLFSVCMIFELATHGSDTVGAIEAFKLGWSEKRGGGFIGGLFAWLCVSGFGQVGAYVLAVALIIISFILITERLLLNDVKRGSKNIRRKSRHAGSKAKLSYDEQIARKRREDMEDGIRARAAEKRRDDKHAVGLRTAANMLKEAEADEAAQEIEIKEVSAKDAVSEEDAGVSERDRVRRGVTLDTKLTAENDTTVHDTDDIREVSFDDFTGAYDEDTDIERVSLVSGEESATTLEEAYDYEPADEVKRAVYVEPEEPASDIAVNGNTVNVSVNDDRRPQTAAPTAPTPTVNTTGATKARPVNSNYKFPPIALLKQPPKSKGEQNGAKTLEETKAKLEKTLHDFGVNVTVTGASCGPTVTRYEIQPEPGVKVSRIVNLADDIKLNLAAADIRIEAPIPGKPSVGIEVPNKENVAVTLRQLIDSDDFKKTESKIAFASGMDIGGNIVISDIAKMPHLLIAGTTGSGKSVCINTIIMSILYKAKPDEVKLILIDPKVVELSVYNGIPHLLCPVVTDPKKAAGALNWAVKEMTERYQKFADNHVRDMKGYNAHLPEGEPKMPQLVVVVDELADLMMVASKEVEESICRLAQLARAAGIHLIIATQRPSVDVITGLIKANMPSRIAFAVSSGVDSRTILDMQGAEKLLGKGDMLYYPQGFTKPLRVQGAFVSDEEVNKVTEFIKEKNGYGEYDEEVEKHLETASQTGASPQSGMSGDLEADDGRDSFFEEAGRLIIESGKGSIGMLQRKFRIGFNRAARIMDQLTESGVVGPEEGTKPRRVLMTIEQFEELCA